MIQKESDRPTQLLHMPFLNPQNGPIMIEGAENGDAVAVYIESMVPRGENPRGTCCMISEFGALTSTYSYGHLPNMRACSSPPHTLALPKAQMQAGTESTSDHPTEFTARIPSPARRSP